MYKELIQGMKHLPNYHQHVCGNDLRLKGILKLVALVRSSLCKGTCCQGTSPEPKCATHASHHTSPLLIANPAGASVCPCLCLQKKQNSGILVFRIIWCGVSSFTQCHVICVYFKSPSCSLETGALQLLVVIGNHLFASTEESFAKWFIWYEEHWALGLPLGTTLAYHSPQSWWCC